VWEDGASNGGAPIIDYILKYAVSTDDTFTTVDSAITTKSFTV